MRSAARPSVLAALALLAHNSLAQVQERTRAFVGESIGITVLDAHTFRVNGTYIFQGNVSEANSFRIFYPIPLDSNLSFPLDFSVDGSGRETQVRPDQKGRGFYISMPRTTADSCTLVVHYTQSTSNGTGRYILTSTAAWGAPLQWGEYVLSAPRTMTVDYLSYQPDTTETAGEQVVYRFRKTGFLPPKDIIFGWRPTKSRNHRGRLQ